MVSTSNKQSHRHGLQSSRKKLFHPNSHFIKTQEWLRSVQTSVILGKCISENGFHQKQKQLLRSFLKMVFPKDQKTSPTPTPKKTQNISENVFAQNQRVLEQFRQCFPQNQKWLKSFQKMCFPKTKKKSLEHSRILLSPQPKTQQDL